MSGPVMSIFGLLLVHMIALPFLYWMLGDSIRDMLRMRPDDDDDGGLPPADDPVRKPSPGGGGLPLPDAEQSPVRLREPGRIGAAKPRPGRRPEHEPQRAPQRV